MLIARTVKIEDPIWVATLISYGASIQMNRQIGSFDPLLINWLAVALTLAGSLWSGWWLLSGRGGGVWLVLLFLTFTAGFLYRVLELGKARRSADR
ncbi:MAG: hypothetical protein V2J42_01610 [Wenzhouxiangella sp.]|jgi:hypothetical protein|nr:hypothetical protein [Wenzhouxiangella sp.]